MKNKKYMSSQFNTDHEEVREAADFEGSRGPPIQMTMSSMLVQHDA